jgi:hypothetical protein
VARVHRVLPIRSFEGFGGNSRTPSVCCLARAHAAGARMIVIEVFARGCEPSWRMLSCERYWRSGFASKSPMS